MLVDLLKYEFLGWFKIKRVCSMWNFNNFRKPTCKLLFTQHDQMLMNTFYCRGRMWSRIPDEQWRGNDRRCNVDCIFFILLLVMTFVPTYDIKFVRSKNRRTYDQINWSTLRFTKLTFFQTISICKSFIYAGQKISIFEFYEFWLFQ